jgi:hypothetical protein
MLLCTEILFIIKGVIRIEKINIKSNDMEILEDHFKKISGR